MSTLGNQMIWIHIACVLCTLLLILGANFISGGMSSNASEIPGSGQIVIDSIRIHCGEGTATVDVVYTLTEISRFLLLVFGSSSLERNIVDILGFTNVHIESVGYDKAELILSNVATVYGDGTYWLPAHTFHTMIPIVEIITPQEVHIYKNVTEFSGIAYYAKTDQS